MGAWQGSQEGEGQGLTCLLWNVSRATSYTTSTSSVGPQACLCSS